MNQKHNCVSPALILASWPLPSSRSKGEFQQSLPEHIGMRARTCDTSILHHCNWRHLGMQLSKTMTMGLHLHYVGSVDSWFRWQVTGFKLGAPKQPRGTVTIRASCLRSRTCKHTENIAQIWFNDSQIVYIALQSIWCVYINILHIHNIYIYASIYVRIFIYIYEIFPVFISTELSNYLWDISLWVIRNEQGRYRPWCICTSKEGKIQVVPPRSTAPFCGALPSLEIPSSASTHTVLTWTDPALIMLW